MTRFAGAPASPARRAIPDVYTALLLVGVLFLMVSLIVVSVDLLRNWGLTFGQLFTGVQLPR